MNPHERILVWLLRLGGVVMLVALGAVVMPHAWMSTISQHAELGTLPDLPILGYLTRSASALYALHGALLILLANDVRGYLPVVRFLAVAGVVFGGIMLGIDILVRMPLAWTLAEGPFISVSGAVMFWLSGRVESPADESGRGR